MSETTYQKLKQFYKDQKIPFREIDHAPGASAEDYHNALGCRYEQQLKCLLVKVYEPGNEHFAIVTIPAQKRVDFEKIKLLFNAKKIRGATLDELRRVTGCEYGEVPAAGKIFWHTLGHGRRFSTREGSLYECWNRHKIICC